MTNVPKVPGVPSLGSYEASSIVLLIADAINLVIGAPQSLWGIFLDGEPVIESDSMISFDLRQDLPISDYQVEEGAFQSYDKVQLPTEIRVRVSAGGDIANRQRFLQSIDAVMNTTDLYDVVTPEQVYPSYNFTHRDLRRESEKGNGLIVVDLWMTQVRESVQTTFSNTATPGGAGQQNSGNVQPQTVSDPISQGFSDGGWKVQ
jgi:hypothetical protein